MNSKTVTVATFAVACLLVGGTAWREIRARLETAHALEVAERRNAETIAETKRIEIRLGAAEKVRAELYPALEELRKITPAPVTVKAVGPPAASPDQMALMQRDPKLRSLFVAAQQAMLATRYNAFFRKARLSPEQIEQFDAIMILRTEQNLDIDAVARSRGVAVDSPELAPLRQQADTEIDTAQTALLGPAGFAEFKQYQRAAGLRAVMGNFVNAAAIEGMALTGEQADQMIQALSNASSSYRSGGTAAFGNLEDIDWNAVDNRARSILSEGQLSIYQRIGLRTTVSDWFVGVFNKAIKEDMASSPGLTTKRSE